MPIQKEVKVVISAVDQYSAGMLGFGGQALKIIGWVEAIAAAMVAASIVAGKFAADLGQNIWKSATDFHDAIYNVEAVAQSFGTTGQEISDILDDLTQKFPVTGKQAGESMQLIAQLGYGSAEELRNMSEAANTLAIATGTNLQTGVMGTLAILNSFNLESSEATRIINLLAAASFSSAANVEDLGIALRYAAPIASLMGVSVEETVAALAVLRDRGLEASQTGTTLRMALIQLGKETKAKAEVLRQYGLTFKEVNPEVVGLTGVVEAFNGQMLKGSDAAVLFGTRSVAMANIINMGADSWNNYRSSITGTNAAYDAMEKKLETWTVVQKNVIGNLDLFAKTIGGDTIASILHMIGTTEDEGLRGVINYLTKLEERTGTLNEAFVGPIQYAMNLVKEIFDEQFDNRLTNVYDFMGMIALALSENLKLLMDWGSFFGIVAGDMVNEMEDIQNGLKLINIAFGLVAGPLALVHDTFALFVNTFNGAIAIIKADLIRLKIAWKDIQIAIASVIGMIPGWSDSMEDFIAQAEEKIKEYKGEIVAVKNEWEDNEYIDFVLDDVVRMIDQMNEKINNLEAPTPALDTFWPEETVAKVEDDLAKIAEGFQVLDDETLAYADTLNTELASPIAVHKEAMKDFGTLVKEMGDDTKNYFSQFSNIANDTGITGLNTELEKQRDIITEVDTQFMYYGMGLEKVGDAAEELETKIKDIRAPGDLIFNTITGEAILMSGAINEGLEEIKVLDKTIDEMSDREFKIHTEQLQHNLKMAEDDAKRTHEIIKQKVEWKAKLDIAQVEANAEVLKAAFEGVGKSVEATASAAGTMFDKLLDFQGSMSDKWLYQEILQEQMALQKQALDQQKALNDAEIAFLKAKTELLKTEDAANLIQVQVVGETEPWLKGLLESLFKELLIKAANEPFKVFGA